MTILFDCSRISKPARPFATGLIFPRRQPYSAADLAWATEHLNSTTGVYSVVGRSDAALEQAAGAALAQARMDAGYGPF